ncbi:hypothetical protein GCM10027194_28370 [Thalassiella azotivora]
MPVAVVGALVAVGTTGAAPPRQAAPPTPDPFVEPVPFAERPVLRVPSGPVQPTAVIALHGYTSNPTETVDRLGVGDWVDAGDVTVVLPAGLGPRPSWNAGGCCGSAARSGVDDVAYVTWLARGLLAQGASDVLLVGYSNGGMLAYRVACEHPDVVQDIAVVNGTIAVAECPGAFSALHLAGELDDAVPVAGVEVVPYLFTGFRPLADLPAIAPNATLDVRVLPGVGHEVSPQARELVAQWVAAHATSSTPARGAIGSPAD